MQNGVLGGPLLTQEQMEIVARLVELDPVRTFPRRGAEAVAELAGATGFRLRIGDELTASEPAPTGPAAFEGQLVTAGNDLGVLQLYGPVSDSGRAIARWACRLLAPSLRNASRLDGRNHARTYEDVQAMLERTPLTPRERDVVGRLLSGSSTRQIASSTGLTVATVNTYLKRIFAKLGVHSRVELVARVTGTRGVIPPGPAKEDSDSPSP